jgi:hypothetical protein
MFSLVNCISQFSHSDNSADLQEHTGSVGTYRNRNHVVQSLADFAIKSREIFHKLYRATLAIVIFRAGARTEGLPGVVLCFLFFYIRWSCTGGI